MAMSADWFPADIAGELVEIVLRGVEHPGMRRMLEHVVREGDLQRACILKDMHLEWLQMKPCPQHS